MEKNATTHRAQVHAFVDRKVRDQLHAVARANDRSLAAEVRRALESHVRREQVDRELARVNEQAAGYRPIREEQHS